MSSDEFPGGETRFICPECQAISYHPMDFRFGYCGRCKAFTGEPQAFVYADDSPEYAAFCERSGEAVRARFDPERHLLAEESPIYGAIVRRRNAIEFRHEERLALEVRRPADWPVVVIESKAVPPGHTLIGAFGKGAYLYAPPPVRWRRTRATLRRLRGRLRLSTQR